MRRNLGGLHDCFTPLAMYLRARNDREPNTYGSILISWVDHSSNAYRDHVHAIWLLILTSCSTDRPSGEAESGAGKQRVVYLRGKNGWWRSLDLSKLSRHFSARRSKRFQFSRFELKTGLRCPRTAWMIFILLEPRALLARPRVMAVWPNIGMCRACRFLLVQVVNCSIKRHGVPPVLRNIGEAIASDLRVMKMCVTARECETRPPSVLISKWAAMYCRS